LLFFHLHLFKELGSSDFFKDLKSTAKELRHNLSPRNKLSALTVVERSKRLGYFSDLNLVMAGTRDGLATMMEGEARCLDHNLFIGRMIFT
jgi:hypothetical protein